MKFAHEFKEALIREGFPASWVESAIPYSQLKKVIKKVLIELQTIGLDPATLTQFKPDLNQQLQQGERGSDDRGLAYRYDFEGDHEVFRPKLTLYFEDELAVNATLSSDTRAFLEDLVIKQKGSLIVASNQQNATEDEPILPVPSNPSTEVPISNGPRIRRVDVNLTFDTEFFDLLQGNVTNLDKLQAGEQQAITSDILELSLELTGLTKPPSRFQKTDMYQWRELFYIYLEAAVFFSTRETDHGTRSSAQAASQLAWFQKEVVKRGLAAGFKLPHSRQALDRFVRINIMLLSNLKYQELQQKAIGKITKKFEKRTKLDATRTFPRIIKLDPIMSDTMAKAVCAQLSQDLIKLTPQLDDYLCPVCLTIAFRPIRMKCRHVLCIRCTVLLQRQNKGSCPICREDVIMLANTDNIDKELQTFQKQYFPEETRQKKIDIETADGIEQFGVLYKHPSESKCAIM